MGPKWFMQARWFHDLRTEALKKPVRSLKT